MATKFSQLYKQELKSQGILSSLGSAALKKTKERMDIRNTLFGGNGIVSLTGQKIFGKGYSGALSSSPTTASAVSDSQGITDLLASSDRQESLLRLISKNTFNMNGMARDMNITRQNIATLTKKMTGRASRSQDALWYGAGARNKSLDSYFGKKGKTKEEDKSPTSTAESSSMIGSLASGILGVGGSMLSGIAGVAGTIGSGVLGAIGAIARISPILGIIGLSATAYVIKKLSEHVDFSGIADSLAKTLGIDLKSDKSILEQFAEKLDTMFNTKAFTGTLNWVRTAFAPVIDTVGKHIATVADVAMVYSKAAFVTLAESFSNMGKVIGFLFNEFFQSNKGKILMAITAGIVAAYARSPATAAAALAAIVGAGVIGAATGEDSRDEMKQKIEDKSKELAAMQGGRALAEEQQKKGGLFLDNTNVKLLKDIQELEANLKKKTDEYNSLTGNVITEGNFSKYIEKYKNELPGGKYGGGYQSSTPNSNAPIRISSDYGLRTHPISGRSSFHEGVDISMPEGTDIYASESGTVKRSGSATGYGNMIEIDHGNGKTTRYAHLKSMNVAVGDMVEKGQKIALSGNSGDSTGPHLHFEERDNGQPVRPTPQLLMSAIKGQLLNDGSISLADANRPDTTPPAITVVQQSQPAPAQTRSIQGSTASVFNPDILPQLMQYNILNPARIGS